MLDGKQVAQVLREQGITTDSPRQYGIDSVQLFAASGNYVQTICP